MIFEVVARHDSFRKAADELYLTPGAVGQQIQKLETWLGIELFHRHAKRIAITPQGREYYSRVVPALIQIEQASRNIRNQRDNAVSLSLMPSLAAKWLGTRMVDFVTRNPDIDIHIDANIQTVQFAEQPIDLAIRFFDGNDSSLECRLLYKGESRLLCSPHYQKRIGPHTPNDLVRATLLHTILHARWVDWLRDYTDISSEQQQTIHGIHYNQILPAIEAAKRHQGVVLSTPLLVQDELNACELVEPFKKRLSYPDGYYLVHPRNAKLGTAAEALKSWLLEQFQ